MMLGLDGADPLLIKKYISEGKLPNFKKVMDMGVNTPDLGMQGVLPGVTPPNWATLATGAYPVTHGVTCFWNHKLGNELDQLDYGWNSDLLRAESVWEAFNRVGKKSILFNYPTAWPPKTDDIYIDGTSIYTNLRGYVDYEKVYTCIEGDFPIEEKYHEMDNSGTDCRVEGDVVSLKACISQEEAKPDDEEESMGYTQPSGVVTSEEDGEMSQDQPNADQIKTPVKSATGWKNAPANAKEMVMPVNSGQARRYALVIAEDGQIYNKIQIFKRKKDTEPLGECYADQWSGWIYDTFNINGKDTPVAYKLRVLNMKADGSFIRLYYSFVLNLKGGKYFSPAGIGEEIYQKVGPMLQPTNFDRNNAFADAIMNESIAEMYQWHVRAMDYLLKNKEWDLFYSHMHGIDMYNHYFLEFVSPEHSPNEYERYREQIYKIYEISDNFVGEMLKHLDDETAIIITSDHGAVPKSPEIKEFPRIGDMWGINVGIMSELGYTKTKEVKGTLQIDWANTTAVAQRSTFIYVNLKGRDPQGVVDPANYDKLVEQIIDDLYAYRDPNTGKRVITLALNRADMELVGLGGENCGDIFYIMEPTFTRCHGNALSNHCNLGYSMKPLLMMVGAGFKKGGVVINRPVKAVDVVPTICHLAGAPMPQHVEGAVLYQYLED